MALISCSECGSQVSDQADSCVRCGAPLASSDTVLVIQRARKMSASIQTWAGVGDGVHTDDLRNGGEVRISKKGAFSVQVVPPMGSASRTIRLNPRDQRRVIVAPSVTGMKVREI